MSYNWVDASTKQGLERFKELGDMKLAVITRSGDGTLSECFCEPDGTIIINQIGYEDWEDAEENNAFFSLEFLDPSPEPVVDENGLLPCPCCNREVSVFMQPSNDGSIIWHKVAHGPSADCSISMIGNGMDDLRRQWNRRAGKEANP